MDSGLVRLLIVAGLFLLLAGDYGFILNQLTGIFGDEEDDKRITEDTTQVAALKESAVHTVKAHLLSTIKNSCLPKLICELNATPQKSHLSDSEKAILTLISDTSMSTTAEVTSKYHFAAHMGQLISGVDGTGCHNFYPSCPYPGSQVLNILKNIRLRPPS